MDSILIKNGYLCDPANEREGTYDILIREGRIAAVEKAIGEAADRVIDAKGLTVLPGLVDMHVHFRDPGLTYKEDIETGARAAAHGGVTAVLAMPNTKPPMDRGDRVSYVVNKARAVAPIRVYQVGTLTEGMAGQKMSDIAGMVAAGAMAFSEDGKSVVNTLVLREAMREAEKYGKPVLAHCEDLMLVNGGVMNEDENALRLGLPGIPQVSEDVIIARDMMLAKDTGCRLHLCHCSTEGSVALIRAAKEMGIRITAETCPHYLLLTSDDIPADDGNYKMNPPLRTKADREAVRQAVKEGLIDVIVTDHAPHSPQEKGGGFRTSPFGIVGLETSCALIYTEFVRTKEMTLADMVRRMSLTPAKILGVEAGTLSVGAPADVAVFDFEHAFRIDPAKFFSKGKNTPFTGREVYGRAMVTICGGRVVWEVTA